LISGIGAGLLKATHALAFLGTRNSDDAFGESFWLLAALLPVLSILLLACAAYMFWGRYFIAAQDGVVTVFKGLGSLGRTQTFDLSEVNGVCLTTAEAEDDRVKPVIRVEGIGFYVEFGADLPDTQRAYTALFLLQKRLEQQAPARARAADLG
jgi:hypothetical protein